ncbi:MAG: type IV pili twitching motility protein PilT [Acidobacteria bacterium]|nr:MAG: type IV pili twitching motility protein PilT [Acidobacteriota bacterium]
MPNRIDAFLELVVKQNGSDLHLIAFNPPRLRLHGELIAIKYRELTNNEINGLLNEIMSPTAQKSVADTGQVDFAYGIPGLARFRVHVFRHVRGVAAVLRVIPEVAKSFEELNLPPVLRNFTKQQRGLVLVTGPTGSGKSTTLAALIDEINSSRKGHIITIEDPIEFTHPHKQCLISQREVGFHTGSFIEALHSALREDPDVILVGEMRDLQTISLALTAAETGTLIFGTLHTNNASATVDRIVNVYPAAEQARVRTMLSTSLVGVVAQQLIRRADGRGRLAAVEVLVNNSAIANMIRDGKTEQIPNSIQAGGLQGMQSLDSALRRMLDSKLITAKDAYLKATVKRDFEQDAAREFA